jgi:hypothetical protein
MRKLCFILFLIGCVGFGYGQDYRNSQNGNNSNPAYQIDTTTFNNQTTIKIDGKTKYTDYKVISLNNDTTFVDTTLSIQKEYKLNFTRKDNFEYMGFHNMGETFNKLAYNFQGNDIFPLIGFTGEQRSYYGLDDIYYYSVPTPTSELMARTGIQQGQVLDALLTANTSKQFNISIAYKGLRSLGKYRNSLASQGNFRTSFNYTTKNKRYTVRGHMYSFDFYNQQNGGLTPESLFYFETNNPNYTDRSRLETNFTDGDNKFEGKRYYLDQSVALFSNRIPAKVKVEKSKQSVELDSLQKISKKDSHLKKKPQKLIDSIVTANTIVKDSIQKPLVLDSLTVDSAIVKTDSIQKPIVLDSLMVNSALVKTDSISLKSSNLTSSDSINTAPIVLKDSVVKKDKLSKPFLDFRLGNSLLYETKHYYFNQATTNDYFGPSFVDDIQDHTSYQTFNGQLYLQLNSAYIGSLRVKMNYFNYNYHYNSILYYDDYTIPDKLVGDALSLGADWSKKFGKINISGDASTTVIGNLNGSTLKGTVSFQQDSLFTFNGFAEVTSKSPNLNTQLYQSDYIEYNWYNKFSNEVITTFGGEFNSEKLATVQASYNFVDNYVFFNEAGLPEQSTETLSYLRVKLIKTITYKKFSLDNTVLYQNVTSGQDFFRVPEWTTRNSLYYSTFVFKGKPLYLQTGVTFKYFTSYYMNAYNPLISEFSIQNTDLIGNFPLLDFFFNFQVQRTRFYFKLENFSSSFTGRDYFSAPTYPYRDLQFRFGLVWNFFI